VDLFKLNNKYGHIVLKAPRAIKNTKEIDANLEKYGLAIEKAEKAKVVAQKEGVYLKVLNQEKNPKLNYIALEKDGFLWIYDLEVIDFEENLCEQKLLEDNLQKMAYPCF